MLRVFDCEIKNIILEKGNVKFVLKSKNKIFEYKINESLIRIKERIKQLKSGERKTFYASYGVFGNIDISINGNNLEMFDMPYMIIVNLKDFEEKINKLK